MKSKAQEKMNNIDSGWIIPDTIAEGKHKGRLKKVLSDNMVVIGERAYAMANYYYGILPNESIIHRIVNESSDRSACVASLAALTAELYIKSVWYRSANSNIYIEGHKYSDILNKLPDNARDIVYYYAKEYGLDRESYDDLLSRIDDTFISCRYNYELFEYFVEMEKVLFNLKVLKAAADDVECQCDTGCRLETMK